MKKTLIALAAVAATGAAMAQSSVTLSGTIDPGFQKRWSGDAFRMTGDRNGTSNWTLRGSEDLGGGLKANFQISTSFNPDTGTLAATNALGNNGMFVELQGGFGQLRAGRPAHILWSNALTANGTKGVSGHDAASVLGGFVPYSVSGTAVTAAVLGRAKAGGAANAVYVDNAVQYFSPRFNGLQVQVEFAPHEGNPTGSNKSVNGRGIALRYDEGPISASLVNYRAARSDVPSTANTKAVNQLAAAYDFGVARVFFTWRDQGGLASDRDNSYALGVTAPVGPGTVYASYNVNEQAGTDGRTIIAGYKYSLSKRTTLYVNLANRNAAWLGGQRLASGTVGSADVVNNTVPNKSTTGYGFGLQHNF